MIEPATEEDRDWLLELWKANEEHLGWFGPRTWHMFWKGHAPNEHWDVLRPQGFIRWRNRRDGWRTVYDIAVAEQGKGLGRLLMEHVGRPVRLKTNASNLNAQGFYRHLGLSIAARSHTRDGRGIVEFVGL